MFNRRLGAGQIRNTAQTNLIGNSGIQGSTVAMDTPLATQVQEAPSIPVQAPSSPMYTPGMAPGLALQAMNVPHPSGWVNPRVAQFGGGWGRMFFGNRGGNGEG